MSFNPFPNNKILDWSNVKDFADDNFKFYENGRMFFKPAENNVGKGEIARPKLQDFRLVQVERVCRRQNQIL